MNLPKDPVMLLSVINTELRDNYDSLESLAASYGIEAGDIEQKLNAINCFYDRDTNRFA